LNKEQEIKKFKAEMKSLMDSSTIYLDSGLMAVENGENPENVSAKIKDKLLFLEKALDLKSRSFPETANKLKLTQEEYNAIFMDLSKEMKPLTDKYQALKEKGVKIK
jgi:hypothetical protein